MFQLRHEIICRELGWREIHESGLETDIYDANAVHFGCFCDNTLVGGQRLIKWPNRFMVGLDGEYDNIGETIKNPINTDQAAEVSRFIIKKEFRTICYNNFTDSMCAPALEIFKRIYHYCKDHNLNYIYTGADIAFLINFRRKLGPMPTVSARKKTKDGYKIEVGLLNLENWDEYAKIKKRKLYDFITAY
jgi:N-acyl-L-homoserine lactone synthetase